MLVNPICAQSFCEVLRDVGSLGGLADHCFHIDDYGVHLKANMGPDGHVWLCYNVVSSRRELVAVVYDGCDLIRPLIQSNNANHLLATDRRENWAESTPRRSQSAVRTK